MASKMGWGSRMMRCLGMAAVVRAAQLRGVNPHNATINFAGGESSAQSQAQLKFKQMINSHIFSAAELDLPEQFSETCRAQLSALQQNGIPADVVGAKLPNFSEAVNVQALPHFGPNSMPRIAYLYTVCNERQIPMMKRVLKRLHTDDDVFLYLIDQQVAPHMKEKLMAMLHDTLKELAFEKHGHVFIQQDSHMHGEIKVHGFGTAGKESNVWVMPMEVHMRFFFFQRIRVVQQGFRFLLSQKDQSTNKPKWDFVVHLSESDYPLHNPKWIKTWLSTRAGYNFVESVPMPDPNWYWDSPQAMSTDGIGSSVFVCDNFATMEPRIPYPQHEAQTAGTKFSHGSEWWIVTKEVAQYVISDLPGVKNFDTLMSLRCAADEIYFPTLVNNIGEFTQTVDTQSRWFIKWGRGDTAHSPDTFEGDNVMIHRNELMHNIREYLFLRKVALPPEGYNTQGAQLLKDIDTYAAQEIAVMEQQAQR